MASHRWMQSVGVGSQEERHGLERYRNGLFLACLLAGTVLIRIVHRDQSLVENSVGRQIPTAMVARNLDRGSGFLHPQLDTAPFPNFFVVEPPIYESIVVILRQLSGERLDASGRIVSALATALGAWGLHGLVRRREGASAAAAAVLAFSVFPVTLRYGRAFQPDALMLGAVLAGLDCSDRAVRGPVWWWWPAGLFLAIGFAAKITSAVVLAPLLLVIARRRQVTAGLAACAALLPALCWYGWANHLIASSGSRASAENRAIWMAVVGVSALSRVETLRQIGRFLLVRSFTPLGIVLGAYGVISPPGEATADRDGPWDLWKVWGLCALGMLALLGSKLHHEYYLLILSAPLAAGLGRLWARRREWPPVVTWAAAVAFLITSGLLAGGTWHVPPEWTSLGAAAAQVRQVVPPDDWVVAVEPLLFQADRRGCRLELTSAAAARAAAEWPLPPEKPVREPIDLVAFYQARGARFVADLRAGPGDDRRKALHQSIRARYKVVVDTEAVLIAELPPTETAGHGQ